MSSWEFTIMYAGLCVLLRGANIGAWRMAERRWAVEDDPPAVDAYEIALLDGGPQRAIATAVALLRRRGVVRDGASPGTLAIASELDADADPLERAVYDDVRRSGQIATTALRKQPAGSDALARIETGLTQSRLLVGRRSTALVRCLALGGPSVLLVLGVARLATHWDYDHDEPMRYLLLITLGVAFVAVDHLIAQLRFDGRLFPTATGRALLERWRPEHPDTSESEEERLALAIALGGDTSARAATACGASTLVAQQLEPHDASSALLIAEELLLLGSAQSRDGRPGTELGAQLAGAVLTELMLRGRIAVEAQTNADQPAVAVLDPSATGDDLLNEALGLLTRNATLVTRPSLNYRVCGWAARRRLRSRGAVSPRDVVSWWRKYWMIAEFPGLAPTVVQQLLTLMEGLDPIEDHVARRLVDRGVLRWQFAGPWPYVLIAHDMHADLRERVRSVALAPDRHDDPATAYLLAMCALYYTDWALEAVIDNMSERWIVRPHARSVLEEQPIARGVTLIVDKHKRALDDIY